MHDQTDEEPPPLSTDLDGWRRAVSDGSFRGFRMEAVVSAIQDLGPTTDPPVVNPLAQHVSDTILRILRRKVSKYHHNEGHDIIEEAHGKLVEAMLRPNSADGKGLRKAFVPRIQFRAADAIRRAEKHELAGDADDAPLAEAVRRARDDRMELDERLDVESVLSHVADERKRLAFRLHMEGIPLESNKGASISKVLGVSGKTSGHWIEEVRAQLRNIVGEKGHD